MGANPRPKGGGGQSTLEACAQPLAVEFLLLLFFAQTKEKKGTPQRVKSSPQRYLPLGAAPNINELTPLILAEKWLHLNSSLLFFFGELVWVSFDDLLDVILEPALRDASELFVGGVR